MNAPLIIGARAAFATYWFLTVVWCFFAYDPFTYQQVIQFQLIGGLSAFARWHPWIFFPAHLALLATFPPGRRRQLIAVISGALGLGFLVRSLLTNLQNDPTSLVLSFVCILPLVGVAALDFVDARAALMQPLQTDPVRRVFRASLGAGTLAWLLHSMSAWPQAHQVLDKSLPFVLLQSFAAHIAVASGTLALLLFVTGLTRRYLNRLWVELGLGAALLAAGIAGVLFQWAFPAVSFTGTNAALLAGALALGLVLSLSGTGLRLGVRPGLSGFDYLLRPLAFDGATGWRWLLPLCCLIVGLSTARLDWNFLGARISAISLWFSLGATLFVVPERRPVQVAPVYGAALWAAALLVGSWQVSAWIARTSTSERAEALNRYAGMDGSFRMLFGATTEASTGDDSEFFSFLASKTNLPAELDIKPVDLQLAGAPTGSPASYRPNIFVFVIDSLRRDYLSPFNDAVHFTPEIAAFARDSDAFSNTFTRYGATGLSEPSIWVGGVMPHKQYITPFQPLNSLQKLIDAEQYQQFVSVDSILQVVLGPPSPRLTPLDVNILNKDYDFCRTLGELGGRLKDRNKDEGPVFAYTQPQDVHISRINREGASVPAGESYPGFYAPYASRVHRFDACFGRFLTQLKEQGLYDDSVIVLTADHGDSLGEENRWGHAYTVYPEVVRIPLIVHLPPKLRGSLATDTTDLTFSTDITPTLYALLGHQPQLGNPLFGTALYRQPGDKTRRHPEPAVLASSYGPAYGLLSDEGKHLYIADAVNFSDDAYDIGTEAAGRRVSVEPEEREEAQKAIHTQIDALELFYKVPQKH